MNVLIIEDGGFDSGLNLVHVSDILLGRNPAGIEEETVCKYFTFCQRLENALRGKGYVLSLSFRRRWDIEDRDSLDGYEVVICDLGFPTNERLNESEVEELCRIHEKELNSTFEVLRREIGIRYTLTVAFRELCRHSLEEIRKIAENSPECGFHLVAKHARQKKVSFYTTDLGHAYDTLPLGIITGVFAPQDIEEVIGKGIDDLNFRKSKNGKLFVGLKKKFDNWVRCVEAAIESQIGVDICG